MLVKYFLFKSFLFIFRIIIMLSRMIAIRSFSSTTQLSAKKIAVVLSGNGVYDGTEVHEAAACLAAITRNGFERTTCLEGNQHVVKDTPGRTFSITRLHAGLI